MAITTSGKDKLTRNIRAYWKGYDISGDGRTFGTLQNSYEAADLSGVSETVRNYTAGGTGRMLGVEGFQALMNDASGRVSDILQGAPVETGHFSMGFGGGGIPAVGDPAYHLPAVSVSDTINFDGSAGVMNVDFVVEQAQYTAAVKGGCGVVLRGPTSMAAAVTASSSNSFDFGAAGGTNAGWSAILQVTATSSGNYVLRIEHSTDDSSFATLSTFTSTGGAVASELLTGTDTVNRYVAFESVKTAGSCTVIITFVRN